jgi:hypothetical protein
MLGAFVVFLVIRQFAPELGPRFTLDSDRMKLRPGDAASVRWSFVGGLIPARTIEVLLVGSEECTSGGGSSVRSDRRRFYTKECFSGVWPDDRDGQCMVRLPADAIPSFESPHNRIGWTVAVRASRPGLIPTEREFFLEVTDA